MIFDGAIDGEPKVAARRGPRRVFSTFHLAREIDDDDRSHTGPQTVVPIGTQSFDQLGRRGGPVLGICGEDVM
jgi:hypothetical protein